MTDQFSPWAETQYRQKYAQPGEEWSDTARRVAQEVFRAIEHRHSRATHEGVARVERLITERKFLPGGRYLYAAGRPYHQINNCFLLRATDTREGWADLNAKSTLTLMTGGGIGVDYSELRPSGSPVSRTGGVASGPIAAMKAVNEIGRQVMQGGARRSAIWAALRWDHADVLAFVRAKDWSPDVRALKAQAAQTGRDFPADLDMTNISVILDRRFFDAYESGDGHAQAVYAKVLDKMLTTGEPGFSIDYDNPRESLRNACTELTSEDDSDVCNLGSLNLARFDTIEDFAEAVRWATLFLLAGTEYSDVPYSKVREVRVKNRRLGLGLMGMHEWLLRRGKPYGPDAELGQWLRAYAESTAIAHEWADAFSLSRPVKTRAIAPTGTIGIIGETTTGIEPIYCVAVKRRYRTGDMADGYAYQYVIDPTAKRLVDQGVEPEDIEDAYGLSQDPERRVAFQSWVQGYVDHGIASTVNLPAPVTDPDEQAAYGSMLMEYLPQLRGLTLYPDGARHGQPLTPVSYAEAEGQEGVVFEEDEERCVGGVCGV